MRCDHCHADVAPVCPKCGTRLLLCPHCGERIKHDWKACPSCGERIILDGLHAADKAIVGEVGTVKPCNAAVSELDQVMSDSREYYRLMVSQSSRNVFIGDHASSRLAAWEQAANSEAEDGLFLVGLCSEFGAGMAKDTERACQLYRQAAVMGHVPSQFALGCQVQETDPTEAARWWWSAAGQEYSPAMVMLGKAYLEGTGVKPDAEKATAWFQRASELGDPSAQCIYGLCLAQGDGVKKDESEAKKWLKEAARAGKDRAKKALDVLATEEGASLEEDSLELGKCLQCGKPVWGDFENTPAFMRETLDGKQAKGNAPFCPRCQEWVHEGCAKRNFMGSKKCPLCGTKLESKGDNYMRIFG